MFYGHKKTASCNDGRRVKYFQWPAKNLEKNSGIHFQHYKDKESLYFCAFCFQRLEIMQGVQRQKWSALVRCRFLEQFTTSQKEKGHSALLLFAEVIEVSSESSSGLNKNRMYFVLAIFFEGKKVRNRRLQLIFRAAHFHQSVTQKSHI